MDKAERLDDVEESLRLAIEGELSKLQTAMPCIVESVDFVANTVSAQPAIKAVITSKDGSERSAKLPLLVDVPIVWPRAGGFALTFPIAAGDEVLVVFGSRCIDSWWQSGGIGEQAEFRMHDLSDGFAILAPTSQPKRLVGVSSTNVQLRDSAGTTRVEIMPDGKANVSAAAEVSITAPAIKLNGAVDVTGGLSVDGIAFGSHKHTGVTVGGGTSGGPTN